MRALHRREHGFAVPRRKRAEIEDVRAGAQLLRRCFAALHHRAPRDDGDVVAFAHALGDAERQRKIVAGIGAARACGVEHVAVFEEHDRVVTAERRAQQADRVFSV